MGVARCDRQGVIVEMNPIFERTLGRKSGNTLPLQLYDLVGSEERDHLARLVQELMDARRSSFRLQARSTASDQRSGQTNGTEWTAWRVFNDDEEENASDSFVIIESLPDDQQSDHRLQQCQRWEAVGRLAGGVFHDFNNLLTGVMLNCDLLLAGLESGNRLRRYGDEIRSAILQASGLLRQLLVLARVRGTERRSLSLNEVAAGMQNLLGRLIGENIALKFLLAPDLGLVNIDPAQAQQILLNLVLNARDALPQGGSITVETSNCRLQSLPESELARETAFPCVLLTVADTGRGMDAETRQRLFEPFFTTKSPDQGNGLGLTTVHNIISSNGGLIHVHSEPGRGTRMMILLPRASDSAGDFQKTAHRDSEVPPQTRLQIPLEELIP